MRFIKNKNLHIYKAHKEVCVAKVKYNAGDVFEVDEADQNVLNEVYGYVLQRKVEPLAIPEKGKFQAIKTFPLLEDEGNLTDVKNGEVIFLLSKELILGLILEGKVVPDNPKECWCPRKLPEEIKPKMPWEQANEKRGNWITGYKKDTGQHPVKGLDKIKT